MLFSHHSHDCRSCLAFINLPSCFRSSSDLVILLRCFIVFCPKHCYRSFAWLFYHTVWYILCIWTFYCMFIHILMRVFKPRVTYIWNKKCCAIYIFGANFCICFIKWHQCWISDVTVFTYCYSALWFSLRRFVNWDWKKNKKKCLIKKLDIVSQIQLNMIITAIICQPYNIFWDFIQFLFTLVLFVVLLCIVY